MHFRSACRAAKRKGFSDESLLRGSCTRHDPPRIVAPVQPGGAPADRAEVLGSESSSQLQAIVDEASSVLGRPIVIDDRRWRLLAHSPHTEDQVDLTRRLLIMRQPLPADLREWLDRHGAWSSERPFRVPANDGLEFDARAGAPIRCHSHYLGSMWCTDRDESMTDVELERLGEFADEAAVVLYREMLLTDLDRSRERELLRDILSPEEAIQREAARQLAELDLFVPRGRVVVLVAPFEQEGDTTDQGAKLAVDAALMRVRRHLAPKHALHLARPTHAVILASVNEPRLKAGGLPAFAEDVSAEVKSSLAGDGQDRRQIVAVGGVARELTTALASYTQALRAADVAKAVSSFGDVVSWDELGVYQLLTEMPIDGFGQNSLHSGLQALLESRRADELLPTLERYLDLAGDTQRTAESLYVHRTTLYHRLRQIERIAEVDLGNGDDRLGLHLSLKVARLQGLTLPTPGDDATRSARE